MKKFTTPSFSSRFFKAIFSVVVLLALLPSVADAQKQTLNPVTKKVSAYIKGYYESLPVSYATQPTKKFPLLIFIHGKGEVGDGSATALPKVANNGVTRLIKDGKFPNSFTVNGESHAFIVIAPQITTNAYTQAPVFIAELLEYCKKNYRVDESRIYITGLSMGGGMTWKAIGANADKFAAAVPICGSVTSTVAEAQVIADNKLPVWATHNDGDPTVSVNVTKGWNTKLINQKTSPAPKMTLFVSKSHDAWSKTYDPNFKEDGKNIYEWMLSYKRGAAAATPAIAAQPPVANAGADQIITLPANSLTLNGSKSATTSGAISSYNWTKISGPAQAVFANAAAASTTVSGLTEGTYKFQLKVTNSSNLSATDTVVVTVKPEPVVIPAPVANAGADQTITLPANSITLDGSKSFATNDKIVSYKWTKTYGGAATITNAAAATTTVTGLVQGTYSFTLTVTNSKQMSSSVTINVTVNAAVADGYPISDAGKNQIITLPLNTVTVDGTASKATVGRLISYKWTKVSGAAATIVNPDKAITEITGLTQGVYEFALQVTSDKGRRTTATVTITVKAAAATSARVAPTEETISYENTAVISALKANLTEISMYPNPVVSDLNVKINSQAVGQTNIMIYDLSGKLLMQQQFNKTDANTLYKNFNLAPLPAGIYLVKVLIGNQVNEVSKIVKK